MALPDPSSSSTALVTGASSGIGEQFACALARRGHGLTLVARRAEPLERLAEELHREHGVTADHVSADLGDAGQRDSLAEEVQRRGRAVEVLVNCAGFGVYGPFARNDRDRELLQLRVLVEAVVDLTSRYLPDMVERGRGAVLNISSVSGLQPLPHSATYAAAKAYVDFFSDAVHAELAGTGVTMTAVLPGPVRTGFQETADANHFTDRMPKLAFVSAQRVAEDGLAAAERGRRSVIPGGVAVRASFRPTRFAPRRLALAVGGRLIARPEDR